jgi:NAD(P)-dependent dehydrogenase (short-subunit alcohol dehydrogenase family)
MGRAITDRLLDLGWRMVRVSRRRPEIASPHFHWLEADLGEPAASERVAMLADPARASTPPRQPPLGRFVPPEEVAGLTAFLLGHEGGSITGQQLVICGGASL